MRPQSLGHVPDVPVLHGMRAALSCCIHVNPFYLLIGLVSFLFHTWSHDAFMWAELVYASIYIYITVQNLLLYARFRMYVQALECAREVCAYKSLCAQHIYKYDKKLKK